MTILLILAALAIAAAVYFKSLIFGLLALSLLGAAMTSKLSRLPQSLGIVATTFLLSWTGLEAAFAFIETAPAAHVQFLKPDSEKPSDYWQSNAAYGVLPSGGVHRARKATTDGELIYDVTYMIGADGFREAPEDGPADGKSVYFLGGSATFGEGLDDDQTLPWAFHQMQPDLKVHNKAVSGWGLHQVYAVWQDQVTEPGATIIVQTAPWHADRAACIPKFSGLSPRYEVKGEDLEIAGRCRTWFDNRVLSRAMISSHVLQRVYDVWNRERAQGKMDLYLAMLKEMGELADERGQCFIVAFNKAEEVYMADAGRTNEDIVERLTAYGLDIVDTTLAERKEDLDPIHFIQGDGHPSAMANKAKAELLLPANARCDQKLLAKSN